MKYNQIIKEYRVSNQLNQTQFGKIFNVSQDTVSLWEKGKLKPDFETLKKMSVLFDVTSDELLEIDTEEKRKEILKSLRAER